MSSWVKDFIEDIFVLIVVFLIISIPVIGYLYHIFHCILHEKDLMLLVGIFVFPVGIIHGWMVILGYIQ